MMVEEEEPGRSDGTSNGRDTSPTSRNQVGRLKPRPDGTMCVRCGYDLRGGSLLAEGTCPECGAPLSLNQWFYADPTTRWRRKLVRGLYLIIWTMAVSIVVSLFYLPLTYLSIIDAGYGTPDWLNTLVWASWYIAIGMSRLLTPIGVFLATVPPALPNDPGETMIMSRCRLWARWLTVGCGAAVLALPVFDWLLEIAHEEFGLGYGTLPLWTPELSLVVSLLRPVFPWLISAGYILFLIYLLLLISATDRGRLYGQLRILIAVETLYCIVAIAANIWIHYTADDNSGTITNQRVSAYQQVQTVALLFRIVHVAVLAWTVMVLWHLARWFGRGLKGPKINKSATRP